MADRFSCALRGAAAMAALAAVGLLPAGSDGMPMYRLDGNPGPGTAALNSAAGLVTQRAVAVARSSARVTVVTAALSRLEAQAEAATEAYDRAVASEQQAAVAYQEAVARLAAARSTEQAASQRIAQQAAADYETQGGLGPLAVLLGGPGGPGAFLNALGIEQVLASQRTDKLATSQADTAVATVFSRQAAAALAQEQADVAQVTALRLAAQVAVTHQVAAVNAAQSAQGQAAALLAIAKTDNAKLQAEHRAAVLAAQQAAAAQRAAAQREAQLDAADASTSGSGTSGSGDPGSGVPAWSTGAGASVGQGDIAANWALTQMGKPYQWGAAGPDTYDCSGLTMDAWAQAGISIGHWTGWQWASGPHIPLDQLRRGDLVFFATDTADPATIHHVGIYIGGDMMVDAPYTGVDVRIDSIFQDGLIGATRPAN